MTVSIITEKLRWTALKCSFVCTYNVAVKGNLVGHPVDVVGATDCDAVPNLDGALKVHILAGLGLTHGRHQFVVD